MNGEGSTWLTRFAADIVTATEADLERDVSLGGTLRLAAEGSLEVCYAPFEHIDPSARVVLLGITPGRRQAIDALKAVRRQLVAGANHADALRVAKSCASFSGPPRSNLVALLDNIGLNNWLNIRSTASLWSEHNNLVHFTSALRFPVFVASKNYSGQPRMTTTPLLTKFMAECLAEEARLLSKAVWIPLGPQATLAADWLIANGHLTSERILKGLPHPSGANAERIAYFLGRKPRELLSTKTNATALDAVRSAIHQQVASLSSA